MRHNNDLTRPKKQENQKHIKIKSRIKSRGKDIVIPRPKPILVPIGPVHNNEASDKGAEVPGTEVTVEKGHAGKEDCRIEEVEFGAWEFAVENVYEDGGYGADEETVRDGFEEGECEEAFWSLVDQKRDCKRKVDDSAYYQNILNACCQHLRKTLSSPLVIGVIYISVQELCFGAQDPTYYSVIDRDTDEGAE